jgi:hypothetical protein
MTHAMNKNVKKSVEFCVSFRRRVLSACPSNRTAKINMPFAESRTAAYAPSVRRLRSCPADRRQHLGAPPLIPAAHSGPLGDGER